MGRPFPNLELFSDAVGKIAHFTGFIPQIPNEDAIFIGPGMEHSEIGK
jgi:hypothetical protein